MESMSLNKKQTFQRFLPCQIQTRGERGHERIVKTTGCPALLPFHVPINCYKPRSGPSPWVLPCLHVHGGWDDGRAAARQAGHRAAKEEGKTAKKAEVKKSGCLKSTFYQTDNCLYLLKLQSLRKIFELQHPLSVHPLIQSHMKLLVFPSFLSCLLCNPLIIHASVFCSFVHIWEMIPVIHCYRIFEKTRSLILV